MEFCTPFSVTTAYDCPLAALLRLHNVPGLRETYVLCNSYILNIPLYQSFRTSVIVDRVLNTLASDAPGLAGTLRVLSIVTLSAAANTGFLSFISVFVMPKPLTLVTAQSI